VSNFLFNSHRVNIPLQRFSSRGDYETLGNVLSVSVCVLKPICPSVPVRLGKDYLNVLETELYQSNAT